jgi:hypothetical protein
MEPELALSGYAEWFWLMAKNWKDVENRNWPLPSKMQRQLPVRIYLHASKTKTPKDDLDFICHRLSAEQLAEMRTVDWSKYRGTIIGEVTIVKQVVIWNKPTDFCSAWFFGDYGFLVQDGVLYERPIACKGKLGFFKPALSEGAE